MAILGLGLGLELGLGWNTKLPKLARKGDHKIAIIGNFMHNIVKLAVKSQGRIYKQDTDSNLPFLEF